MQQSRWYAHLPALRDELAALQTPTLDRGMVEQFFGLSRRGAIRLMALVQPARPGTANVLAREQLLGWLDRLERTRPVADAIARERRLRAELAAAAREAAARACPVAQPLQVPEEDRDDTRHGTSGWPAGIALPEPGLLAIRFGSAADLLGAVLALAEAAAADYPGFAARLEGGARPAGERNELLLDPALEPAP